MLLRPRQILAPIVFATVFGYFGYHLVNGDRGLLAMVHLQREVLVAEQNLTEAETTRKIWERRVSALRNQSLDPDMLDERARVLLNFSRKDDTVIFTPTRDALISFAQRPPETNCPGEGAVANILSNAAPHPLSAGFLLLDQPHRSGRCYKP
jgi:cell division protein FtsB